MLLSNLKTQEMAFSGVDPGLPKTLTKLGRLTLALSENIFTFIPGSMFIVK